MQATPPRAGAWRVRVTAAVSVALVLLVGSGRSGALAAPPRAKVAGVAPRLIVVAASRRPRAVGVVFGIRRYRQGRLVLHRARPNGRATVRSLRPGTLYVVRARWARRGARWGRKVFVRTLRAGAAKSPAGSRPALGLNDSTNAWKHPGEFFGDARAIGATTVWSILPWREFEPRQGTPDYSALRWRMLDALYARAVRDGFALGLAINQPPGWARQAPYGSRRGGTPTMSAWLRFVRRLAARYPLTAAWSWNEPGCCSIESVIPAPDLARMIDAAYPVWHAANAATDVVMGSWDSGGGTTLPGLTQVTSIRLIGEMATHPSAYGLAHGPRFDSWGLHLYGRPADWPPSTAPSTGNAFALHDLGRILAVLDAAFPRRRVRVHLTETGWMTPGGYFGGGMDEQAQADAASWTLRAAARFAPRLIEVVWYLDRDQPANRSTRNVWTTGLRYANGAPKRLLRVLAARARATPR
jgi:hypothetical protein